MGGVSIGILAVLILCFGIVVAHRFNSEFKSATQRELNTAYQQVLQNPANASLWKNMASEYARIGAIGNARACFAVASLDEGRNSEIREDMCDFSRVTEILSRIEKTGGQLESYWIEKLSRNAREKNMPSLASSLEVFRS
jgi:hypothetical protein